MTSGSEFLIPAFTRRRLAIHRVFLGAWAAALAILWAWWLQPEHKLDPLWFVVNSVVLAWVTLMPAYLLFVLGRGRIPNPAIPIPPGLLVAMVVTKVPSEPWPMVRHTLIAMLKQPYPHDTWLADEDPSPDAVAWCAAHGVCISTRRGCPEYHRAEWPRRRRCKEGNLAYFYDHYGYGLYDFVIQLDAAHVPNPTYLAEMLRPFADPTVGYVSAPSICDRNAASSWSARSRLYAEGMLHGGLQVGYNGGFAPLCFGSHYAVRTQALKEIGGLGPELAEDHSTTLLMNAHGWRGVHAVNAIAHGDGPETFADLATQEFQWSRSLTTILLRYTPRYLGMLPWRLKFQFLFSQIWYVLFSGMMAISYALPLIAILNNRSMVKVTYLDFFVRFQLVTAILMAMGFWWHSNGWARPRNAKAFSWESAVFLMARWPWSLLGVLAGSVNVLSGKEANFRITPKASGDRPKVPFQVVLPYLILSTCSSWCVLSTNSEAVCGYYVFACINAIFYALVLAVILAMHWLEGKPADHVASGRVLKPFELANCARVLAVIAPLFLALGGIAERGPEGAEFLLAGAQMTPNASHRLTDNKSGVSERFTGNTKLDGAELTEVSSDSLVEPKTGTPIWFPEISHTSGPDAALSSKGTALNTSPITKAEEHRALQYGVYDPEERFASSDRIGVEHIFVNWQLNEAVRLRRASESAASKNRWLMVTVEPWPAHRRTGETLFKDITDGTYDTDITRVASMLAGLGRPVFIRWGHEMEELTGRYPWASRDAGGYIKAYRYFVDHCRPWSNGRFYFVWSPKGKKAMCAYYPGANYVDYVGLSLYGHERWDIDHYGKPRDFNERFQEIYSFASVYKKPVMIAELGVAGDAAYRHLWLSQLAAASTAFPRLRIAVYFDAVDPEPWPDGYGNPDWRIEPGDLGPVGK